MMTKPRFRLIKMGNEWYCLPVNDAAEAMKIPAWKLFIEVKGKDK